MKMNALLCMLVALHATACMCLPQETQRQPPPSAPPSRAVLTWLYCGNYKTNQSWAQLYQEYSLHSENMTAVSPTTYLLNSTGQFASQVPASILELARTWSPRFAAELALQVTPLIAFNPSGTHRLVASPALQQRFIAQAVSEARLLNYSGYNIDAEMPGNASFASAYLSFVDDFAEQLHVHNMTLTMEISGDCQGPDEAGTTCKQLRESKLDRIISMATYTADRTKWVRFVSDLVGGIGAAKLGVGLEHNQVFEDYQYTLGKLVELGVQEIDFWCGPPPTPNVWDGFGYFLHAATPSAQENDGIRVASASTPRPPNVVVLFADDLGLNQIQVPHADYGYTGDNGSISTPHLAQFAAEGMTFTNWYSSFHVCSPSRASMMTGRYSVRCGIGISPAQYAPHCPGNAPNNQVLTAEAIGGLPTNETTLAQLLEAAGYRNMMIGKWHLGVRPMYLPTSFGFHEYYGIPFSQDMGMSFWQTKDYRPSDPFQPTPLPMLNGTTIIEQPTDLSLLAERYADAAADFIKRQASEDKPFYLYLSFNHVHTPNSCGPRFCGSSPRGAIGDAVQELDWAIGQVMQALKDAGVDNNTLTFFTSDNGAPLGNDEQGNLPLRDGKASTWEGGFREPGMARWPGRIQPGSVSRALVSTMDIFATAAALASVPVPKDRVVDGMDISPVLFGQNDSAHDCIMFYHNAIASNASGELYAIRCGRYKMYWRVHSTRDQPWPEGIQDPPLLFDLDSDPGEAEPIDPKSSDYAQANATLHTAKERHLATITPVPDQNGRGSNRSYAFCSKPDSKLQYPQWPNCTLTPEHWVVQSICSTPKCISVQRQLNQSCHPDVCPSATCPGVPTANRIGCFHDKQGGKCDLPVIGTGNCHGQTPKPSDPNMSVDKCNSLCQSYSYFAVQNGGTGCFCGNSYGSQGSAPPRACNMTCSGNPKETCGGPNLNSVFKVFPIHATP